MDINACMIQMRSVSIKEHKGGGSYSCPPVQEEDEHHEEAEEREMETETSKLNRRDKKVVVEMDPNKDDKTCSCQIYCNRNDSVPSTTSTQSNNNNGDIMGKILSRTRSKRKSLWSRSQHSRRLKMVVPSASGGEDVFVVLDQNVSKVLCKMLKSVL